MPSTAERRILFLLIGQSNMAGRGDLAELPLGPDPRLLVHRETGWETAKEPLHSDPRKWAGAGLGMSFGLTLLSALPDCTVGLIPCAVGGSPLAQWMPGAPLYEAAVNAWRLAARGEAVAGILWHQGETDGEGEDTARTYAARVRAFFPALRRDIGSPHAPIVVGELGTFLRDSAEIRWSAEVNAALRGLPSELPACACVSSEGLSDRGDRLHFGTPSLRILGERYARAWLSLAGSARARA
jgi:hypothetical protein